MWYITHTPDPEDFSVSAEQLLDNPVEGDTAG